MDDVLTLEYAGETLSRYEIEYQPGNGGTSGKLRDVRCPELSETVHLVPQLRLFGLEEALGEGWLKALKLDGYTPRRTGRLQALQEALFPCLEALG